MEETYLSDFKNVINYQVNEINTQVQLSLQDINCPIRTELGQTIDLVYMRLLRIALRDTFGSKLSNSLLYESGKNLALNNIKVKNITELAEYLEQLMIGFIRIVHMDEHKIIIEEDECAVCSGLPDIGEPLCSFECGFIAGGLSSIYHQDIKVMETKCWGLGDTLCRFEADLKPKEQPREDQGKIDTVDLITTLASKASMAIDLNKELKEKNDIFTKQLEMAQNIQKKIIPHSDGFLSDYFKFYSYLKPFRKVGGDFYDFFHLNRDKVGIAIADMAGHGIDAAMITGMVKLILQHFKKVRGLLEKPSKIMELMEDDIQEVIPDNFFSMIYMVIDPHNLSIRYCNAGHPAAILYRKKQNIIQFLNANHPLVGLRNYIQEDYGFNQKSVLYERGDQLFLYTDGIPETRNNNGEFFHINKVLDIIRDPNDTDIDAICEQIIDSIKMHRNGKDEEDDVCLIGIQL
ncbi:MAG: SpoIIE family protein phosphatase [Eubacteriales bacterium]